MKLPELKRRFKNKYVIRIAAGVLTVAIAGTSYGAYTVCAEKGTKAEQTTEAKNSTEEDLKEVLSSKIAESDENVGKDETVYVIANNTGKAETVIVSDWLKNPEGKDKLEDVSDLKDIKNVKGNEKFTEKDGKLTWEAKGNDIYYQGTTDKELPVDQTISYYMDGKKMSPDEIVGKSGKVTIRFDYKNNVKTTETVNGKEHSVYVPFTVLTGMVLDDSFSNVEVSNGKVVSDGNNQIVVGVAMPGLSDSLKVDSSDFSEDVTIPEYIEVTADVKDFSLNMTMSVMMSTLTNGMDFDELFDLNTLDDAIQTMADSSSQLANGSKDLADGLDTLNGKMGEFAAGVQSLKAGVDKLGGGAGSLAAGVNTLNTSAKSISDGIATLDAGLKAPMSDEAKAAAQAQAAQQVDAMMADPNQAMNKANIKALAMQTLQQKGFDETVKVDLREKIAVAAQESNVAAAEASTGYDRRAAVAAIYNATPALQSGVAAQLGLAAAVPDYETLETAVVNSTMNTMAELITDKVIEGVKTGAQSAVVSGAESAKAQIAAQIEAVQANGYSLVTGSAALSAGTQQLASQIPTLTNGVSELVNGTGKIATATGQLSDGVGQLEKGSNTLSEGMIKFDQEGIQKLADTYNGDVKDLVERIVAVMQAGSDYQAFSQVSDDTTGVVKFITRTEGVEK